MPTPQPTQPPLDPALDSELRFLAAKIATAYARANTIAAAELPGLIRMAYGSLLTCARPKPPPPQKPQRGRPRRKRP